MKKTVLITGCSTGFGKTTTEYFVEKGWNVIATMRNPEKSTLPKSEQILVTKLDVQNIASIESAIAEGIKKFGKIDALINNAGFGLFGLLETTPREKILEQFEVNVFGVMDATRAILPHFRKNQSGTIVNISSGAGVFTLPMLSMYCASKFALEGFSEGISYELASQGIQVKIVEPGGVTSTGFVNRSGTEAGHNATIQEYDSFVNKTNEIFAGLRSSRRSATELDVAKVIYNAATDGSSQLRYIATDDIKPLIKNRRETSEENYIDFMRKQFS